MADDKKKTSTEIVPTDAELELNEPERSALSPGPREHLPKAEQRQRIKIMERLISAGSTDTEIEQVMEKKFGMDEAAARRCEQAVYAKWGSEDSRRGPHLKAAARRRLYKALKKATVDRSWNAVSNLEKVLSGIEGTTVDPRETTTPAELRIQESMLRILGELDETTVIKVIERERSISITKEGSKCLP